MLGPSPSDRRSPDTFSAASETTASSAIQAVMTQGAALTGRHRASAAGAAGDSAYHAEGAEVSEVAEKV
jgi:hypothetical protein